HTNAVYGFVSMLVNVLKERQPSHIAVAFDISRETFRTAAYPEYKAGRAKTPPEFKGQVELIKQLLEALNISVVTVEGFEADDILATLAHHSPEPVRIISGDRDSFQLVNHNVTVLYPRKGMSDLVNMTDEAIREKYDVGAAQYRDLAALVGETSDNLPGIPGVGPKTAAKWINQYGSALEVLAHKDEITGKVGEALREHVALVERNYELNRLVDTLDIPTDVTAYEKREYDAAAVNQLLDALEFGALRARLFAAWPSGDAMADAAASGGAKTGAGAKGKSAGKAGAGIGSAAVDVVATPAETGESFSAEVTQVDAKALKKWLGDHAKTPVALSFAGKWGRGTGTIDAVALTGEDGSAIWCTYIQGEEVLTNWLESDAPKIVHDAKGPAIALLNQGVRLAGLVSDPAIGAYIVSPGTRNFELGELVTRYLGKSLTFAEKPEEERSLFSEEPEVSGELLAMQARANLELSEHFDNELAQRGGAELFSTIEIPLIGVLADLEATGIAVDVQAMRGLEATFEADAQAAVKQAHASVGHEFNLGSPKQLQEVLFEERGLPKTKKIKTGYTTDAEA
ncbi:MAG: DNA polymerase I, partial [Oxalobacteraceae bacterium]|nr:DNA polymerase I [Oxalobacteraceae bacterium]